jgi:hypothetical protein
VAPTHMMKPNRWKLGSPWMPSKNSVGDPVKI